MKKDKKTYSESEGLELLHKLEVHQIELEMKNEELLRSNSVAEEAVAKYKKLQSELNERLKELSCHNRISEIMSTPGLSLEEVCRDVLQVIPDSFQFPEIAVASLEIDDTCYTTPGFRKTEHSLLSVIMVAGKAVGHVEVCYPAEKIPVTGQVFLPEETKLLFSIAERLGNYFEKKEKERALRLGEMNYRSLIENLSEVIYEIDNKGKILYISKPIEKILGYTVAELTGRNFLEFVGLNETDLAVRFSQLHVSQELYAEYKILTKTGEPRWMRFSTKARLRDNVFVGAMGMLVDITESKLLALEVQKNESLFRSILNASPDTITITDPGGKIIYTSPSGQHMYGYSDPDYYLNRDIFDFIDENDHARARSAMESMMAGNLGSVEEYSGLRVDGTKFAMEVNGEFIRDAEGQIVNWMFISRDVSERIKAENTLRESEEKFRGIAEQTSDVISICDMDGVITYASPASAAIFRMSPEAMCGRNFTGFIKEQDIENGMEAFRGCSEGSGRIRNAAFRMKRADGSDFIGELNGSSFRAGTHKGILVIIRDITDRRRAEEELLKFRTISDQANYGSAITTLDGVFIYVNESLARMHGWDAGELPGKHFSMLHDPGQEQRVVELMDMIKNKGEFYAEESWRIRKDGTLFPAMVNASLIRNADNVPQFISTTMIDITELKRSQEEIRRSEATLNQAQEMARMGSWELSLITGKYTWSANNYKLVGMVPFEKEVTVDFFMQMVHPDDLPLLNANIQVVLEKKQPVSMDIRIIIPDGQVTWIQNNIAPAFEGDSIVALKGVNIDITEKKQAEEKIRQQNERLQAIINAMPDLIFVIHRDGVYQELYYSKPESLPVKKEQIIGTNLNDFFNGKEAAQYMQKISECILHDELVTFEYEVAEENSARSYEARLTRLGHDKILSFVRDITDRKRSEKEISELNSNLERRVTERTLQLAEANVTLLNEIDERKRAEEALSIEKRRLDDIIKGTNVGTWEWNVQTGEIIFNERWADIIGYTLQEISPINIATWKNFTHTDDRKATDEMLAKHFSGELSYYSCESRMRHKNGDWIWVLDRGRVHKWDQDGKPLLMSGTHQDISARKKAEQALLESQEQLNLVIKGSNDAPWDWNLLTDHIFYSLKWWEQLGYAPGDIPPDSNLWRDLTHPDDVEHVNFIFNNALAGKSEGYEAEFRLQHKNGHYVPVLSRGFITRDATGKPVRVTGTNMDLTERKRATEFEVELLQMSVQLTGIPASEIAPAIEMALGRIGGFLAADRAYVFEINLAEGTMSNTYEWCNKGIHPEIGNLQDVPTAMVPMFMDKFIKHENIIIPSVCDLPETWRSEREMLELQGIKSIIVIPMLIENNVIGFVGLDSVAAKREYKETEVNILKVWGNMLASLINHQRKEDYIGQMRKNYEIFFNTIDDFLFVLDQQGNIIHTNSTVTNRLEYLTEELLGKPVLMVHPPERREEAGRIVGEMLAGTAEFCPVPVMTKSGNIISVETRVKHGYWDGKPVIFGVTKDVSKIKLSEEKFSRAFQSNSTLMAISNISGAFIDVNAAFLDAMGYTREEVIGRTSHELGVFEDPGLRNSIGEKLRNNIPVRNLEVNVRIKSGQQRIGLFSADTIYIGNELCMLTMMVDITERKKAEEELRQARNEADKANMAKSEFLSRMSHELRTPMNSILGFAQLMLMGELKPSHKKGAGHILASGTHLLNLINEVLDITRIEAGRIALSMEPVGVGSVITEMIDIVWPQAVKRNVTIELEQSPANRLFVKADLQRFRQVLLNLMSNAVKYNREGGSVTIKAALQQPLNGEISKVRISFIDTGTGISGEDLEKLFHPFERVGAERSETEGTGLGLTVVKKLIDVMGGVVGVESIPGVGSTFWIELAQAENLSGMTDVPLSKQELSTIAKSGTILYIEDNISNAELVGEILENHRPGLRLITSMFGINAVNEAIEFMPDLILLDLDLPDIHGSKVLSNLQANKETAAIPVVIISADAMPKQVEKLMLEGARDYLTKPLDIHMFLQMVDEWIGERDSGKKIGE